MTSDAFEAAANDLMSFLDASPTAWHAVERARSMLSAAGFQPLAEGDPWLIEPGGRYMLTRGGSAIVALAAGTGALAEHGARVVGAHTDSPALKLKPNSSGAASGYLTLGVEIYGGPIVATWTDRDLAIAGRVVVADAGAPSGVATRLVRIASPLVTVPNIAIHLNRQVNEEGLKPNAQDHMPALLCLEKEGRNPEGALLALVAESLGVEAGAILGHDLFLVDAQPAARAGVDGDLVRSGRLDDLAMCHAALAALLRSCLAPGSTCSSGECASTRIAVLYDSEEVGSATAQGAGSPLLLDVIERLALAQGAGREALMRALTRSWLVSADMAHAIHPSHAAKHDSRHKPVLGGGPVLKVNASMRYATDAEGWAMFERICKQADVPLQRYSHRSDLPCGSTIGPLLSSRMGLRTVDVGNPILGMHSIRETGGARDAELMTRALECFLGS